ncbi:MAG: SH3 domain-containing protein [Bacteroidales bacterium]|nr:SH3 domain-containing protein [Bacteroidales bacterium]
MKKYTLVFLFLTFIACNTQNSSNQEKNSNYTEINKEGIINTFVDGSDIEKVNIWESNKNKDIIITFCLKGESVTVLLSDEYYYKIRTASGQEGWVMKGFVKVKE